jgi:hypothetical protein
MTSQSRPKRGKSSFKHSRISATEGIGLDPSARLARAAAETLESRRLLSAGGVSQNILVLPHFNSSISGDMIVSGQHANTLYQVNPGTGSIDGSVSANSGTALGIRVGPDGNVYSVDYDAGTLEEYNGSTGAHMATIATGLVDPYGLVIANNLFYVSESLGQKVQAFNSAGQVVYTITNPDFSNLPLGMVVTPAGRLLVGTRNGTKIDSFNLDGSNPTTFASNASIGDGFGLAFGPNGNLYESNTATSSVLEFNPTTGAYVTSITGGGLNGPLGIAFGPNGNLYAANGNNNTVSEFNGSTGAAIQTFTSFSGVYDIAFAPIVVTNTSDSGAGSLRQAITSANSASGPVTIDFDIPGAGVQTIFLSSTLPAITNPTIIDGTSQPGYAGSPLIALNGDSGEITEGLVITGGGSTVKGLTINGFADAGILLSTGGGNVITGNYLGTNDSGTDANPNFIAGITISDSSNNVIGGTTAAARNVISGNNEYGIQAADGDNNVIEGNYIGTDLTGTIAVANMFAGIELDGSLDPTNHQNTLIGGTTAGAGNLISGNGDGINIYSALNTTVQGNYIGTDVTGTLPLPNSSDGIQLSDNTSHTTVGGSAANAGNVVAFNGGGGVVIGDTSAGTTQDDGEGGTITTPTPVADSVLGNSIFSNNSLGIDLAGDGVTLNDSAGHSGPNTDIDFPTITSAVVGPNGLTVSGTYPGFAETIQFFSNPAADPSGYGQGKTLLTSPSGTMNSSGNVTSFTLTFPGTSFGPYVSATATDAAGDTSEFSADFAVPVSHAVSWTGGGDGTSWTDPNNWSGDAVPGPTNDVTINGATNPTIVLASGTQSVHSLTTSDPITLSGGSLAVATTADLSANLTLAGGTLQGATINRTGSAEVVVNSGTMDGVTADAPVDVSQVNAAGLTVLDGLVLNSSLLIGNAAGTTYGTVYFGSSNAVAGSLTTTGTGTVLFGGNTNNTLYNYSNLTGTPAVLTIGAGITIHGKDGILSDAYANGSIVNQGTIDADTAAGTLTLGSSTTNSIINSGTMEATSGGTLDLGAAFATAQLGNVQASGGTVNLTGTLTGNLALTAATGSWNLDGGTIINGIYTTSGGSSLIIESGTFDGVTADAPVDLSQANAASLTVLDGVMLNSSLLIGNAAGTTYATVYFGSSNAVAGSLTTTGTGTVLFGGNTNNTLYDYSNLTGTPAALTIGAGITIHGKNGTLSAAYPNGSIVNQGTIDADTPGGTLTIGTGSANALTNSGTLEATGGGTLTVGSPLTESAGSTLSDSATSQINLGGNLIASNTGASSFQPLGNVTLNGSGTSSSPQTLEVMSADLGNVPAGFTNNFAYNALAISSGDYVSLVDQSHNSTGTGPEAVYVNSLSVPAGTTLNLNGLHVYARAAQVAGTVVGGSITVGKSNPTVTWASPASIPFGTALGAAQLDANANVQGTFVYTPAAGTFLPVGGNQTLSVLFTPADATDYNSVTTTTQITVTANNILLVTNTLDSGAGSLRQAILNANNSTSVETINFAIPGAGVHTIFPQTSLPTIAKPTIIDGTSQSGYTGSPLIELNGGGGLALEGLAITGGNSTVKGLIIDGFGDSGILLSSGGNNVIAGNYLGTNTTGSAASPNLVAGITISNSSNNVIGGITTAARNVISGNTQYGIRDGDGNNNVIEGNYIGTNATGTLPIPNLIAGVEVAGSLNPVNHQNTIIGGTIPAARNVISGNVIGVQLYSGTKTVIEGNYIGTDVTGAAALANTFAGVQILDTASNNTIGAGSASTSNIIAFNGNGGVGSGGVVIGDGGTTTIPLGDALLYNSIFSNSGLGISLGSGGANNALAAPTISNIVTASSSAITLQVTAAVGSKVRIELYSNPTATAGQGKTLLIAGSGITVPARSPGQQFSLITATIPALKGTLYISATLTDAANDTSAFSSPYRVN